ncbi:MAG: alanine racemase [Pseudomonadota bacterium]|nr:alanine racemase [Pseudomonadota bacterium]
MSFSRLVVDLDAVSANYRRFVKASVGMTGAVVKANAYGLGTEAVARRLKAEGCEHFFVATPEEGFALRTLINEDAVYVFSGPPDADTATALASANIVPVLNSREQIGLWMRQKRAPAALHVDTGMQRLGFDPNELKPRMLEGIELVLLMSHLACADRPQHPQNERQAGLFSRICDDFPGIETSFGNSAGTLNGTQYQGGITRPGIGLYGGNPYLDKDNDFHHAAVFEAQVMQRRRVNAGESVGYGATFQATRNIEIAIVGVGYADGVSQILSGKGQLAHKGARLPVLGQISMDLTHVDVTEDPDICVGDWLEVFGTTVTLDEVAEMTGTSGYEILSRIGSRVSRVYV